MRDKDGCFAQNKTMELLIQFVLSARVERRGRFVENHNWSILEKCPRQRNFLRFTSGRLESRIVELFGRRRFDAVREASKQIRKARALQNSRHVAGDMKRHIFASVYANRLKSWKTGANSRVY